MNTLDQRFSTGEILKATGLSNAVLQSWLKRSLIVGHRQIAGGGSPGVHRQFSFFNLIELAAAKTLVDLDVRTGAALKAAQRFAHGSDGVRKPGLPYDGRREGGITLLCAAGDQAFAYKVTDAANTFYIDARHRLQSKNFIVIDMSELFERVMAALGRDYRDVLAEAYGPVGE